MANVYATALEGICQQEIDWTNNTIRALLLETGGTFDVTDTTVAGVFASGGSELDADSGYARQDLGTKTLALDGNVVEFGSANVVFTSVDSADLAVAMLIYKFVTNDADSIPICFCDFADEQFTDNNLKTLTVVKPAAGWFSIQNS
jgi:hypothetical protein